ncbi:MAG: Asp-tRNA(Asn)/Glu-tRNA(Gln) amidotransferase subunit GatC [Acidobacteriota bacterium]|nr:Asp-tRNA(Asn)/Glu-tRNA(Gln) amidotransferase subunit GatC [Acidobacteriota bacterium]
MTLTEKDVRYVAELAHLELTDDEVARFVPQLGAILEYVQKLNQLDTSNVEPMSQVIASGFPAPPLRGDVRQEPLSQEEALANAPEAGAGCFKTPKVIERE